MTFLLFALLAAMTPLAQAAMPLNARDSVVLDACNDLKSKVAELFTYEDKGSYVEVVSKMCGEKNADGAYTDTKYILYKRGETKPDLGSGYKYFAVPLQKVVVTQTVTNTFLERLNVRDKIAVASKYSTSACLAKRVADGDVLEYVAHSDATAEAHATQMGDSSIDAIFSDPWYTSSWKEGHTASFDKVICEASPYEKSPLGSAEWIKFFGYLFDVDPADAYCGTTSLYQCQSLTAVKENDRNPADVPKVLFASKDWQGDFAVLTPAYKTQFAIDAGGAYADMSAFNAFQQTSPGTGHISGYKFTAAHKSDFHAALRMADVLIDETYPYGKTLKDIIDEYSLPPVMIGQAWITSGDDPAGEASRDNTGWALVSHGIGEKLYTMNDAGDIVPQLASAMPVKNSDGSWTVTLTTGRMFSDGTTVNAAAVAECLSRTNAKNSNAQSDARTITFEAQGPATLKITTSIVTPVLALVLSNWWSVVYKNGPDYDASVCTSPSPVGVRDPVPRCRLFTGPYEIKHLKTTTTDASGPTGNVLKMVPNPHHPGLLVSRYTVLLCMSCFLVPRVCRWVDRHKRHMAQV